MKLKLIIGALCVVNALSGMSQEITGYPDTTEQRTLSLFDESKSWPVPHSVIKHIPLLQSLNISEKESYLPPAISAEQMEQFLPVLKIYVASKDSGLSDKQKWDALLAKRTSSQLNQIAHVADALGMEAVLEEICKHIAARITTPQAIEESVRRGYYDFPIDSAGTQLAIPVQYIIATHMQPEDFTSRLIQVCSKKLQGHTSWVRSAVFNRVGDKIVTASHDNTARIWNAQTGALEHTLQGHIDWVKSAVFNSAGDKIATASRDGTARIWNAQTGALEHTLQGHTKSVFSAAFNSAGDKIVTASDDHTARIWNAQTGALEHTLQGHTKWVRTAVFNSAGDKIATGSEDCTARIWNAQTGALEHTLQGHTDGVISAEFNSAGDKIMTASWDGTARIWNAQTGELEHVLQGHTDDWVDSAVFNRAGDKISTAYRDNTARIWNVQTGALEHTLQGHTDWVISAVFNSAGDKIVTASNDRTARLWNAQTGALEHILRGHTDKVRSAEFNRAGDKIVTASSDGTARIWPLTVPLLLPEQVALLYVLLKDEKLSKITPAMQAIAAQMPILLREKLYEAYPSLKTHGAEQ